MYQGIYNYEPLCIKVLCEVFWIMWEVNTIHEGKPRDPRGTFPNYRIALSVRATPLQDV
jgi:hypothetical protein